MPSTPSPDACRACVWYSDSAPARGVTVVANTLTATWAWPRWSAAAYTVLRSLSPIASFSWYRPDSTVPGASGLDAINRLRRTLIHGSRFAPQRLHRLHDLGCFCLRHGLDDET